MMHCSCWGGGDVYLHVCLCDCAGVWLGIMCVPAGDRLCVYLCVSHCGMCILRAEICMGALWVSHPAHSISTVAPTCVVCLLICVTPRGPPAVSTNHRTTQQGSKKRTIRFQMFRFKTCF